MMVNHSLKGKNLNEFPAYLLFPQKAATVEITPPE